MNLYQHFRPEEHHFIDQVIEWKEMTTRVYVPKLTDFLDPREQEIVSTVIGKNDEITVKFFGGHENAERKRALICPLYANALEEDFNVSLYEIDYPSKFVKITHRDCLGALMALGLKRQKFGDILSDGERFQIVFASEITDYIIFNFTSIGKAGITMNPQDSSGVIDVTEEWQERVGTVSSLRLDVILAEIHNLSRQKVIPYLEQGLVKVNWKQIEQTSYQCREGDHISLRGYGRSKLLKIEGQTKKEKLRIRFGLLK